VSKERRPFSERLVGRVLRRPYRDAQGRKGWLALLAHPQRHLVRRYALTLPGWPAFSRPLRIVLLSDLHVGSHTGDLARMAAIAGEVTVLAPDLVLFGGDYVNMQPFGGGRVPPDAIAAILAGIAGRHGRFAVMGNHDYVYGVEHVAAAFRGHGIAVLDHARGCFEFEGHAIDVVGVPDAHVVREEARALVAGLAAERPTLVLAHDPGWFLELPEGPFLMLSGHTHGGQIRLPLLGILRNSSRAPLHWSHGHVAERGRHLIVTAGLGTSSIPLRIGVPPEFAVIDVSGEPRRLP
jgi:predicted MPP superfamily phosphohydrolase